MSEYGVDAYDVDAIDAERVAADPRDIGAEDEGLQAEWLLSLVEDLERHASACQVGCAPQEGRIALGGSIMAWQDEWWKGRVIEAVNFDSRTATMGGLCPDLYADSHSGCGYPSAAQPDTCVNEANPSPAPNPTPTPPPPPPYYGQVQPLFQIHVTLQGSKVEFKPTIH